MCFKRKGQIIHSYRSHLEDFTYHFKYELEMPATQPNMRLGHTLSACDIPSFILNWVEDGTVSSLGDFLLDMGMVFIYCWIMGISTFFS